MIRAKNRCFIKIREQSFIFTVGNEYISNVIVIRNYKTFAVARYVLNFSPKDFNIIHCRFNNSLLNEEV